MADNLSVKDGAGAARALRSKEVSPGVHAPFHISADASGVAHGSTNPAPVAIISGGGVSDATAANQASQIAALGAPADAAWNGTAGSTIIAALKAIWGKLGGTIAVSGPLTDTQIRATALPVSAASLPLPSGAATSAKQDALATLVGEVQGNPTANTLLDRLKAIVTALTALLKVDTIVTSTSSDRSGTIATGGTAQQLMASNTSRRGFWLQNQSSGDLWINGQATAVASQPSLRVRAGALYETPPHHSGTGAISIVGATTGQAFAAREF